MKIAPDTTVCVANAEAASLELDVAASAELSTVLLLPRFGEPSVITLNGGAFDFPLLAAPNEVVVEWRTSGADEAAFKNRVEVVTRHYFTLDQIKEYGGGSDDFGSLGDDALYMARQAATEVFEQAAHRSFVKRIGRTKDYGNGELLVLEHHDVQALLTDGYRHASDSQLERMPGYGPFPRFSGYVYGADAMPAEVSRAVLELAAYTLRPSNRPIGATGESTDAGYIHFTTAGRDGATAIPEVNAAIEQFGAGVRFVW